MKKTTLLFFLTLLQLNVFAQEIKFGKISKEELEQKSHPIENEAPAAILSKKHFVRYVYDDNRGFQQVREVNLRIKIYSQEGFNYADHETTLFNTTGNVYESISKVTGSTYSIENGKIVETKLKSDQVFTNKVNDYRKIVKFTMPNIKPGCVIEYKYEITSPFTQSLDEIACQYTIPLDVLAIRIAIPKYYTFKPNIKGYYPINLKQSTEEGVITSTSFARTGGYAQKSTAVSDRFTYVNNVYTINSTSIPSIKDEPFVDNLNNYTTSLNMEIVGVQFPGKNYENYSQTWADVVKSIYKSDSFGNELSKKGYFENDLNAVVGSITDPKEKIAAVLEFCKSKIKWDGNAGYGTKSGVKDAYKNGAGNVGDINLNLINMLNAVGLESYPVLVSTRSNGIPLFPTREGFNYVVASVQYENSTLLLDATDKFSVVNVLPIRAINWNGRLIKKTGDNEQISLFPNFASQENTIVSYTIGDDAKINGKRRSQYTSYQAKSFREKFNNVSKESYLDKLENENKGVDISNHEVTNDKDIYMPVTESYDFAVANGIDAVGKTMMFSPMLYLATSTNPFKSETREFPIDFVYPIKDRKTITVTIPQGYEVESLPTSLNLTLPDNLGSYKYTIQKTAVSIQLSVQLEINNSYISQINYADIRDLFKQMVDKENEKVVLKKI
jgi:hypothetical protein